MTRRTVPEEPPDYLTVDEIAAVMRISRTGAYQRVRRGVATNGREGIPAERVDKQFRISRYVIEERLGGPITWPIPGFHDIPNTRSTDQGEFASELGQLTRLLRGCHVGPPSGRCGNQCRRLAGMGDTDTARTG